MKYLVFFMVVLFSCAEKTEDNTDVAEKTKKDINPGFKSFVKKYQYIQLPLVYHPCLFDSRDLQRVKPNEKFASDKYGQDGFAYCTFKTNGDYVALITCYPGDCMVPLLTTYDLKGNVIDREEVMIGRCGADCGFTCTEYMTIGQDLNIYVCDSITTQTCDSAGYLIPGTKKEYILFSKGKILPSGQIELSEEKQEDY